MIRIRYSPGEVEIEGASSDFVCLAEQVKEFIESSESEYAIYCVQDYDPAPYRDALSKVTFLKERGSLCAQLKEGALQILGSPASLILFAQNLPSTESPTAEENCHVHFDSLSFPHSVSAESAEMVFSLRSAN